MIRTTTTTITTITITVDDDDAVVNDDVDFDDVEAAAAKAICWLYVDVAVVAVASGGRTGTVLRAVGMWWREGHPTLADCHHLPFTNSVSQPGYFRRHDGSRRGDAGSSCRVAVGADTAVLRKCSDQCHLLPSATGPFEGS